MAGQLDIKAIAITKVKPKDATRHPDKLKYAIADIDIKGHKGLKFVS